MRVTTLVALGLVFAAAPTAMILGCTSSETDHPPATSKQPPPDPGGPAGDGPGVVLAIRRLYLGDLDRNGQPNPAAWKDIGYDLDGRISTEQSTDLCQPAAGGSPAVMRPDGHHGIDNSFGRNVWPILAGASSEPASQQVNASLEEGSFTILMQVRDLGSQASYSGLHTNLFGGGDYAAKFGAPPTWSGDDPWPLLHELLVDGKKDNPKVQFPSSYVNDGTWVSGTRTTIELALTVGGFDVGLVIHSALVTFDLAPDRRSATGGVIAGILDTEQFAGEIQRLAGAIDESFCSGSTIEGVITQFRQASDILLDGTQDPSRTCDGVSVGIGFDLAEAALGEVLPPAPPAENPCDGGVD